MNAVGDAADRNVCCGATKHLGPHFAADPAMQLGDAVHALGKPKRQHRHTDGTAARALAPELRERFLREPCVAEWAPQGFPAHLYVVSIVARWHWGMRGKDSGLANALHRGIKSHAS